MDEDDMFDGEEHFENPKPPKEYRPGKLDDKNRYGLLPALKNQNGKAYYIPPDAETDIRISMHQKDPIKYMTDFNMFAPAGVDNKPK